MVWSCWLYWVAKLKHSDVHLLWRTWKRLSLNCWFWLGGLVWLVGNSWLAGIAEMRWLYSGARVGGGRLSIGGTMLPILWVISPLPPSQSQSAYFLNGCLPLPSEIFGLRKETKILTTPSLLLLSSCWYFALVQKGETLVTAAGFVKVPGGTTTQGRGGHKKEWDLRFVFTFWFAPQVKPSWPPHIVLLASPGCIKHIRQQGQTFLHIITDRNAERIEALSHMTPLSKATPCFRVWSISKVLSILHTWHKPPSCLTIV